MSTAVILYIEDEPELREDLAFELADAGYEVIEAEDGVQGLEALAARQVDLILCDVQLPRMGGLELLAEVSRRESLATRPPVVLLTAYGDDDLRREAATLGACAFMVKPVDYIELLDRIETILAENRPNDQQVPR